LFPHDLAQKIRATNAVFIRTQQGLGATILSPKNRDALKTYETGGRHPIRFKCLNPPENNNYLVSFRNGFCWPQPGPFRHIEKNIWEIDAHFGTTGDHTLHLVTASDLGQALVQYYLRVVGINIKREENLKGKLNAADMKLVTWNYIGIQMNGLPKGFRSEASVIVTIAPKPS